MQQALNDLKDIPGVVGAAIFHAQQGVLANNLPSLFKTEKLASIGKLLNKVFSAGRLSFTDLGETSICYEEATLITREIADGRYIMVICDPAANMNLLSMSLKMALEELRTSSVPQPVTAVTGVAAATSTPQSAPIAEQSAPAVDPEALLSSGPLSEPLKVMLQELANTIGPMAEILFQDALSEWCSTFQISATTLPHLVDLICRDIGDSQRSKQYRDAVLGQLKPNVG